MVPVFSLLVFLSISAAIVRVASIALQQTGLSRESSRFQARSAFMGIGFTTSESESVTNHPVRRKIMMLLMLIGNAGFVTMISTSMLTMLSIDENDWLTVLLIGGGGLVVIGALARSRWVDRRVSRTITKLLQRYTTLDVRDYASLLQLSGDYRVAELLVEPENWLAQRNLEELRLRDEGVMVLGINRADGSYVGAPRGTTVINAGDNIILYGKSGICGRLDQRQQGFRGEALHREAVEDQRVEIEEQELQESTPPD